MRTVIVAVLGAFTIWAGAAAADQGRPVHPLAQEHPIEVDATALVPPTYWSVPGVTEPLQSVHDRPVTDKVATLKLKPGRYMYMTTTFGFEFTVNLEGVLDYSKLVEQCVGGRGSAKLVVKCRTMGKAVGPH